MAGGHLAAHLLVGSTVADLYHAGDVALVQELSRLLAPQIEAFVLASQMHVLRKQIGALRSGPANRARIADMLATTAKLPTPPGALPMKFGRWCRATGW